MPSTCVFEFDRLEPIYYAGEVIKGRIILNTTSIKTVNEICILFSGEAKVHWKKINSRTTTDYRGKKTYLNSRTVVHGEGDLPVGTHTYTCSIPLPVECPTSCVEKYGKIFYELSLIIDRPWRFHNNFSQPITVLQTFDLNQNPEYLIPMKQEAIKHFCCWPCSSGSMISTLTIPFGGFAPGQDINYTLQIDNQSSGYDLDRIEVQLHFPQHQPKPKYLSTLYVYIHFEGEAKVRWEESRTRTVNGKTHHYTEYFRATETYLNTRTLVHGDGDLPAGTHTYTCSIPLPLECPTSCVEKYGKISYELSLVIDRSWRFNNVFTQPLTVLRTFNLNLHPEYLIPLRQDDIKHFCCWPCSSGPVISTLTIPFGGYAPGQDINYSLEIDNQSSGYDLDGIELALKQIYRFVAHTPHHKSREHTNTLTEAAQNERVLRLSKRVINGSLTIPPIPPSSLGDGIITVRYCIKMSIKTGDCHKDAEIDLPITIGTIPLAQSARDPSHVDTWIPETPDTPPQQDDPPPSYDKYKPPSFEEATTIGNKFIDIDRDEHNRNDDFVPKYPMYTNFAVPTAPPDTPSTPLIDSNDANNTASAPPLSTQPPNLVGRNYGWTNE